MGDVMTIFPVFQAFWMVLGVVGGMMFYSYDAGFSKVDWYATLAPSAPWCWDAFFCSSTARRSGISAQAARASRASDAARQLVDMRWKHQDLEELDLSTTEASATMSDGCTALRSGTPASEGWRTSRNSFASVSEQDLEEGKLVPGAGRALVGTRRA